MRSRAACCVETVFWLSTSTSANVRAKDSAAAANVSPETIRARRKRIYRKLDLAGSGELISMMLGASLKMLAAGETLTPRTPSTTVQTPSAQPAAAAI